MFQNSTLRSLAISLVGALLVAPAYGFNVNKSINVDEGSTSDGHSTVNGSISVGSNAVIRGSLETVNGTIRVEDNVQLKDAETVNGAVRLGNDVTADDVSSVNGSIRIGERGTIGGEVSVVNGKITLGVGSSVQNDVSNVNGEMVIEGTEIGGNLSTVTGDILLTDKSVLRGDLIIAEPGGWRWNKSRKRKPRIVIGPGSKVIGKIMAEREIELFISDSAEVGGVTGKISMDQAVRFSGNRP